MYCQKDKPITDMVIRTTEPGGSGSGTGGG